MAGPLVHLRSVSKTYTRGKQAVPVLEKLDLEIAKGDFMALMGPSGSGKTTLLNLIGGLDRPDPVIVKDEKTGKKEVHPVLGGVTVDGIRIDQLSSGQLAQWRARHVGFVFQFYNLLPVLTAEKNVELPLLLTSLNKTQRQKHIDTVLEIVGLRDRAKHKPAELSGGQAQRVAIARALVADPTLLVCDEPTGDLDRKTADEILHLLQILNKQHGKTIVMVTHDQKAADFATHELHLDKGVLVEQVRNAA